MYKYIKDSINSTNKIIFEFKAQSCDIMNKIIKREKEIINITKHETLDSKRFRWNINPL